MSKSLGNVIDPLDYIDEYGADALRMGLISGTVNGRDFAFPKDKVIAYRNFANKLWNMARFMIIMMENSHGENFYFDENLNISLGDFDQEMLEKMKKLISSVTASLERYRFADAAEMIYQFMWHEVADKYIEHVKGLDGNQKIVSLSVLRHVFVKGLVLLHPFMPFVTEAIWENIPKFDGEPDLLVQQKWPE